jgi:Secretion system C-terminal sorting domain
MQKSLFLSLACLFAATFAQAQTFYTQDFESTNSFSKPVGWSSKVFNVYPARGVNNSKAIQSVFGVSANFDTLSSDYQVMPSPPFVPAPIILQFKYRVAEYIGGATPFAAPLPVGSKIEVFVEQAGVSYTKVQTISQSPNSAAYVSSGEIVLSNDYYGREIRLIFRVTNTGGSGANYVVQFDDITLGNQLQPVATNDRKIAEGVMKITPNPVQNGLLNLRFEGANEGETSLKVSDITGKVISTQTAQITNNQLLTLDAPRTAGVYFVSATTASGTLTERIIVE